ncbi:hypothetical protein GCM10020216_090200 [Nonomuraea helvata]
MGRIGAQLEPLGDAAPEHRVTGQRQRDRHRGPPMPSRSLGHMRPASPPGGFDTPSGLRRNRSEEEFSGIGAGSDGMNLEEGGEGAPHATEVRKQWLCR